MLESPSPSPGVNPEGAEMAELSGPEQIVAKFKTIRNLAACRKPADFESLQGEEAAYLWNDAAAIRAIVNEILPLLCALPEEELDMQDQELQIDDPNNPLSVFAAVWSCARAIARQDAHRNWRSACGQIVRATRRAEELLRPLLLVEAFPEESDVFTLHTAISLQQPPLAGSATEVTWSAAEETREQEDAEAANLPEKVAGGEAEAKLQALEYELLELQNKYKTTEHNMRNHPDIAATLHSLGTVSREAGDLTQAKQYYDESLRMNRSLHGDRDHRDIAATLHELGTVSREAGDLKQATQYYDESLRMNRSLHDHPRIAVTLHTLGTVNHQAGDLKQATQYYDESLRMERSLYGDRDHPDIAATLHSLGTVNQQAGDLKQAKQYHDESLRMSRSLHGDRDHHDIAQNCMLQ